MWEKKREHPHAGTLALSESSPDCLGAEVCSGGEEWMQVPSFSVAESRLEIAIFFGEKHYSATSFLFSICKKTSKASSKLWRL